MFRWEQNFLLRQGRCRNPTKIRFRERSGYEGRGGGEGGGGGGGGGGEDAEPVFCWHLNSCEFIMYHILFIGIMYHVLNKRPVGWAGGRASIFRVQLIGELLYSVYS